MDNLAKTAHDLLISRGYTLALAESATGGLIAHRLTNNPGSSKYLIASLVIYSIYSKTNLLEIDISKGVVSDTVARELASNVRTKLDTDIGIGITGYAGDSDMEDIPMGRAYVAIDVQGKVRSGQIDAMGDRIENKEIFADWAFIMLVESL
ncbi:MAG: CinA family protein [Candidatus Heimdallarchaeota archaeon]|nr:CinA family protein [Candidatus Heimdallarchaeota archaeon]